MTNINLVRNFTTPSIFHPSSSLPIPEVKPAESPPFEHFPRILDQFFVPHHPAQFFGPDLPRRNRSRRMSRNGTAWRWGRGRPQLRLFGIAISPILQRGIDEGPKILGLG